MTTKPHLLLLWVLAWLLLFVAGSASALSWTFTRAIDLCDAVTHEYDVAHTTCRDQQEGAIGYEGPCDAVMHLRVGVVEPRAEPVWSNVPRGTTRLYRAVSQAELDDVAQFGFRPGPGAMETKLFATSAEDASFFGRDVLFPLDKRPLTILEVEVPESLASRLFRFTADGKPTVALDPALLQEFNAAARVRPLNYSPLPPP